MREIDDFQSTAIKSLELPASLHKFQWDGVFFLYHSSSALLADEMGLGKTVQAIVALNLLLNSQNGIERILIVTPASLTINWISELEVWAPSVTARRLQGNIVDREAIYMLPIPVIVSSYEQIRKDGLDKIPPDTFDLVILDEAQRIKNRNSSTNLACRILPRKRAWALSATPLENERNDILSILDFLEPNVRQRLTTSQLSEKLESIMLRRRKRSVRSELPPVIVQEIKLDLSIEQRLRYNHVWDQRSNHIREQQSRDSSTVMLEIISLLKRICNYDSSSGNSTKLEALLTVIESASQDARFIVFSQFVETLKWISQRLTIPHDLFTGSMSIEEKNTSMEKFKSGETPRILLVSLRAGGVGLNLGQATHVVMFDRWWNPATENQAIFRAHRFSRDEPLHVIRFTIQDSIEERIASIIFRKEQLFEEVVESVETGKSKPSNLDLLEILDLSNSEICKTNH